jgi:hypothetical protein
MVLGTNREDLEVLVASVTGEGEVEGGGKRSVGMKVAHGPELRTGVKVGRIGFGVTGQSQSQSRFCRNRVRSGTLREILGTGFEMEMKREVGQ